jgi:hypothetical protein
MSDVLAAEWVDSEQYLGPKMKRITYQCAKCRHVWTKTFKAEPKRDPPCPNQYCVQLAEMDMLRREMENLKQMLLDQRGPAHIGDKVVVKAIDATADIVMQDYKLTDLKDNIREGEAMAPKLPPPMQKMADGYFGGKGLAEQTGANKMQVERLKQRAIHGAFRGLAVSAPSMAPPGVPQGASPLRVLRTETNTQAKVRPN